MTTQVKTKADRAGLLKKLVNVVKKYCKVPVPKHQLPVMETMLYAVCLEDTTVTHADEFFKAFQVAFPDLNEARVSSLVEIMPVFGGIPDAEWRAFRIRSILQYVFEKNFAFELEGLKKKTLELATKQLAKIESITPFVRAYTIQHALGAHVLPLDGRSLDLLVWLGMIEPGKSADEANELLKGQIRRNEADATIFAVRGLATDARFLAHLKSKPIAGHAAFEAGTAIERLADVMSPKAASATKSAKPAAKKATPKAAAPAKKKAAKTVAPKKAAKPKASVKKAKKSK